MESRSRRFEEARQSYRPQRIKLLIIAESPPSSGGFFYFPKTIGKDHLFRETMKVFDLWPIDATMHRGVDKKSMLERFQSMGVYLVDASAFPVDKLPLAARGKMILSQLPRLIRDLKSLDPQHIVIVKTSIFDSVTSALKESGFEAQILNNSPIPFPSHGNQQKYRSMMKRLLAKAHLC